MFIWTQWASTPRFLWMLESLSRKMQKKWHVENQIFLTDFIIPPASCQASSHISLLSFPRSINFGWRCQLMGRPVCSCKHSDLQHVFWELYMVPSRLQAVDSKSSLSCGLLTLGFSQTETSNWRMFSAVFTIVHRFKSWKVLQRVLIVLLPPLPLCG